MALCVLSSFRVAIDRVAQPPSAVSLKSLMIVERRRPRLRNSLVTLTLKLLYPPTARHRHKFALSKISHQHTVEFFFLFAPFVALVFGFLLFLFFVRRSASILLAACGSAGWVVVLGLVTGGKCRHRCCQGCNSEYADQSCFHEISPISFSMYEGILVIARSERLDL